MSTPQPRPSVAAMPAYVAGKPPAERPGLVTYKLSSNENPYPPLDGVVEVAAAAAARVNRYPDAGSAELYEALAKTYRVPAEEIALSTGAVALIFQLISAYCGPDDEVVFAWRSFEAYPIAVLAAGATAVTVPLRSGEGADNGSHDLDAMAAAITERTKVVFVCTPNNPSGTSVTQTELDAFLAKVPAHVLVVVDEAYAEFVRMDDAVDGVATYRGRSNVVVLRTFSKAYGLAGFRVGYALAPAPIASVLRAMALPFGVNVVAQAAGVASLERQDELLARVEDLTAERTRVLEGVRAAGWDVPDSQGNFVWFAFDSAERCAEFAAAADEVGLMVRPYPPEGVRVSVGEPEANTRFIELVAGFAR